MKVLAVFDNKDYIDRYTVLFTADEHYYYYHMLGMSNSPTHPQGFSQWSGFYAGEIPINDVLNRDTRIEFTDLPEHIQKHVIDRIKPDKLILS